MPEKGETLFDYFSSLPDPRTGNAKRHLFGDIVIIAVCAVLCGADSFAEIAACGKAKRRWFSTFLALPNGIPSHDTFGRVFALLDPGAFEGLFRLWISAVAERLDAYSHIAIDGKTVRRSHDRAHDLGPLHMVSAFAVERGLVLAERAVDMKSNEMKAIPRLLESLLLRGCIVTVDAGGCYKDVVNAVIRGDGDYVIAVKKNQPTLLRDVVRLFAERAAKDSKYASEKDASHGRTQERNCTVVSDEYAPCLSMKTQEAWPSITSAVRIESTRTIRGKTTTETRYYISSLRHVSAQQMLGIIRGHWGIENSLHWVLDIAFREDESRARSGHAQENFTLMRKIAFNILKQEKTVKIGIKGKRLCAAWDEDYLLQLLKMYQV